MLTLCVLLGVLALGNATPSCPGCVSEVDLGANLASAHRKDLIDAAHWATERICESRNSPVHLKFMQLLHATEQVVAGMRYELEIKLGETDCLKSEGERSACLQSPQPHHHTLQCSATVWSRPWLPAPENIQFIGEPSCRG